MNPNKEWFYVKFGLAKIKTAMVIFKNQVQAIEWGLVSK